ncbi:MAG: ADP-ribosylation factor-like protein [Promethearchaeota archaeon]
MYLLILKIYNETNNLTLNDEEIKNALIFSTYNLRFKEKLSQIIYSYYKSYYKTKKLYNSNDFQIGLYTKNNFIISIINPIQEIGVKTVNEEFLLEITKKISDTLQNIDHSIFKTNKNNIAFEINELLKNNVLKWDSSIRLIGSMNVGTTTIFNTFHGITIVNMIEHQLIPFNNTFNGKRIILKEFSGSDRYFIGTNRVKFDENIILVIDSTNLKQINTQDHFIKLCNELYKKDKNILIIANKQDLPGAMKPEEIEKITGCPTVGFSAIMYDAPEKLKEIITNFL